MHTTEQMTMKIPYVVTTSIPAIGTELVVLPAEREVPADWDDVRFLQAIHTNGSICTSECGCIARDDRTEIRRGQTLAIGEWTWYGGNASWLVAWRRTGPSTTEQALIERANVLEEDVEHEKGLHHVTKLDLARNIRNVEALRAGRLRLVKKTAAARYDRMRLKAYFVFASRAAAAGWTLALVLAVALAFTI
jgi:hypothetical protein